MACNYLIAAKTMVERVLTNPTSAGGFGLEEAYPVYYSSECFDEENEETVTDLPCILINVFDSLNIGIFDLTGEITVRIFEEYDSNISDSENIVEIAEVISKLATGLQSLNKFAAGYLLNFKIALDEAPYIEPQDQQNTRMRMAGLTISFGIEE